MISTLDGIVIVPGRIKRAIPTKSPMSKPIIAIDASLIGTQNTGDTSYWRGLLYGLSQIETNAEFHLFAPDQAPLNYDLHPKFTWHHIPAKSRRLWNLKTFPRAADEIMATVLHTQYNISPFIQTPAITTIHDVSFFVNPDWYKLKDRILLTTQIPKTIARAKKILTVSETSRQEIIHHIPQAEPKTIVTYNALGPNFQPQPKEQARSQLNIGQPFVFCITSAWARKNTALAAQAFQLSQLAQTHRLVTCGPGDPILPNSTHLGYVDDLTMRNLYAAADCFLLPSLHEGFGIPLLEAFASQTPVITGSGGAIPEVAADCATICPDYNPKTWAEALNSLNDDSGKLQSMIERGLRRVNDFSWKKTAEMTMESYEEVSRG